ncbi:MAG TPA: helix-turn-helix transcriptional regulator [Polyangiaceae bacterium]
MTDESVMQAAQLQVVQPGSRASFRRRVIDSMRALVSAPGAFVCFGTQDIRAYADSTRLVDGQLAPIRQTEGQRLSAAFGIDVKSVVATQRRAYLTDELYPESERIRLPYFAEHAPGDKMTSALLVFLHEGGVLFGVAGLERRAGDPPFTQDDVRKIEQLASFVVAGARSQIAYDELTREAAALRALGKIKGTLFIVDRDRRAVVWAIDRDRGVDWETDVVPIEKEIIQATEQSIEARAKNEPLPTPPRLPDGTVMGVAKIDGDPVFGGARCAVLRVEPSEKANNPVLEGLSRREREIARLLVAGYSGVNVAAISGLSENTVRTYVRRLYTKVGVSNRADLVRKLVSPEPKSSAPPSQIAPPPDSSLVAGDDTLD